MSRRREARDETPWRSFADLAMGLMAVLALWAAAQTQAASAERDNASAERDNARREETRAKQQRAQAELQARAVLNGLSDLFRDARAKQARQQAALGLIAGAFRDGRCRLELDERTGELCVRQDGEARVACGDGWLFDTGEAAVRPAVEAEFHRCGSAFRFIAARLAPARPCGAPATAPAPGPTVKPAAAGPALAGRTSAVGAPSDATATWADVACDIEAVVLEGHTDRAWGRAGQAGPRRSDGERYLKNAELGARRAHSVLQLITGAVEQAAPVDGEGAGAAAPPEVLRARLRVGSASYGAFAAGPVDVVGFRGVSGAGERARCRGIEAERCEAARTFRLRVQWRDEALRRPLGALLNGICGQLDRRGATDDATPLRLLIDALRRSPPDGRGDPEAELRRAAGCPDPARPEAAP
jgi:hypothetical protein